MGDKTGIEWADATWNPLVGCSVVSPGCIHCYAMQVANARLDGNPNSPHYAGTTRLVNGNAVWTGKLAVASPEIISAPIRWKKPRRIFVNSMSDLFHESVKPEWLDMVMNVMEAAPQHRYMVLTKRSREMRSIMNRLIGKGAYARWRKPLPQLWLGVSAEDQAHADIRLPDLVATPAARRFVSFEPLLGKIELDHVPFVQESDLHLLHWFIVGGESGAKARPMHISWARLLRDYAQRYGIAFTFKQWGEWFPYGHIDADGLQNSCTMGERKSHWKQWLDAREDCFSVRIGKRQAGRYLDGKIWEEEPINVKTADNK